MLSVILLAAGKSSRMQGVDKLAAPLCGMPVLAHSLRLFEKSPLCGEIILVCDNPALCAAAGVYAPQKLKACMSGGNTRAESVCLGLQAAQGEYVCIHDGARPHLSEALLQRVYEAALEHGAAAAALPAADTVKERNGAKLGRTLERDKLLLMQTPQVFRRDWLEKAYAAADFSATDDAELVCRAGYEVMAVEGERSNFKLTVPEDLALMRAVYAETRSGMGFDAHRLTEGRPLILGGVEIPFEKGLLGHSDADVLVHAVMDALLGAAAAGDIGLHFPDTAARYQGISSMLLLQEVAQIVAGQGYVPQNIDATIIAERPRLAPYAAQMRENMAAALGMPPESISIKATTTEGMGFCGGGEGIVAMAICSLLRI